LSAVKVIEPGDISTYKELVIPLRIIHPSVVLIAAARIWHSEVKNAPIRDAIRPVANGLSHSVSRNVPPANPIVRDERTAIRRRHNGGYAGRYSGSAKQRRRYAARILRYHVLLELRCFRELRPHRYCVLQPYPFIGKEKEESILYDWAA